MYRQRFQILGLAAILAALIGVIAFGPNPESDIGRPISEEEIAQWAAQQDTATEDYQIVAAYLVVQADTGDPCADYYVVDLMPQDACSEPPKTEEPTYYR